MRCRSWGVMTVHCAAIAALFLAGGAGIPMRLPQIGAQALAEPLSYTEAQAERGQSAYQEHCTTCHGPNLDDGSFAPPLKGVEFRQRWGSVSAEPLFTVTSTTMPPDRPGSLGDVTYGELLAYILRENGSQPGTRELPPDPAALKALAAPDWPRQYGGGFAPGATIPPAPPRHDPREKIRPVTDAMLLDPPPGDWLLWRRTYDAFGFSPLKGINRTNVADLRVAWSWPLPSGSVSAPPLVHDGVMFVAGNQIQALDAATGDLLWQYSRRTPKGNATLNKRNIAIAGTRLFAATSDGHLVALDVKSGHVIWDQPIADPSAAYRLSSGPLVVRGIVMIGTAGRGEGGNYIVGLDAETGKEAWRFYTIARPDAPGGNSWNGLPLEKRNGASAWIPGSYDAAHNVVLFGTGNTYDTGPLRDLVDRPGISNDGLYTNSTLALDPQTGKLAWYFQHQANDQWDLDWAFERQLMQLSINGRPRDIIVTAGKQLIFDILDAEGGKYISSFDLGGESGVQSIVTAIDPKTGAKTVDAGLIPGDGKTKTICPHIDGGRNWMPTSYDAANKMLYVPWVEACMDLVPVLPGERGALSTGVRWTLRPKAGSDGKYGRLQAINLETKTTAWVERQRAPMTSGVLATAGGLVFTGALDRMFRAHDAATGALLWQMKLIDVPASVPISYAVNGHEYIAVIASPGSHQAGAYTILVPELTKPPTPGTSVWVFEVPAKSSLNKSH